MLNKIFTKEPIKEIVESLNYIDQIKGVKKVVCFPDISLKEKYKNLGYKVDFPSSIAIVSDNNILYPQLNARGINCGMAMIKISGPAIEKKIKEINKIILSLNKGFFYNLFYKYHLPLVDKYNFKSSEMVSISEEGVDYVINKFKLSNNLKNYFIDGGSIKLNQSLAKNKFINKKWPKGPKSMIKKIGRNFYGNHFLELQVLDKIYDENLSKKFNLSKKNSLYVMYHTAGFGLASIANKEFLNKYIYKKKITGIRDNNEKNDTIDLYGALMNFSYVYRFMFYFMLKDKIENNIFGSNVELITDVPHNTLNEERDNYIYRRNAVVVSNNKLSILSGSYNQNSYLNIAGKNANNFYYSADHGSGELLKMIKNNELISSNSVVTRYNLKFGIYNFLFINKQLTKHYINNNLAINLLNKAEIIKTVAGFRPIVNLKYGR